MSELSPPGDVLVLGLTRDSCRVYKTVIVMFGILRTPSRCSYSGRRSGLADLLEFATASELSCLLNMLYDMLASAVTNI